MIASAEQGAAIGEPRAPTQGLARSPCARDPGPDRGSHAGCSCEERRGDSRAHLRADAKGKPSRAGREGTATAEAAHLLRAVEPQLLLAAARHQVRAR